MMGKGYENTLHYRQTVLHFLNIDNIHVIRGAMVKLMELCQPDSATYDNLTFGAKVAETKWLHYLHLILESSVRMARILSEEGASIVCHCSDGWDRTSQLCALTAMLLDPYLRTCEGFAQLIEHDWLSFGHKFAQRFGHADSNHADDQRAPIFVQFIDCVYQLIQQFPLSFEFNESFLLEIIKHLYSCQVSGVVAS